MKPEVITESEADIVEYLKARPGQFVSPTKIGQELAYATWNFSAWASPKCKRLVEEGLLERNEKGHYRYIVEEK